MSVGSRLRLDLETTVALRRVACMNEDRIGDLVSACLTELNHESRPRSSRVLKSAVDGFSSDHLTSHVWISALVTSVRVMGHNDDMSKCLRGLSVTSGRSIVESRTVFLEFNSMWTRLIIRISNATHP